MFVGASRTICRFNQRRLLQVMKNSRGAEGGGGGSIFTLQQKQHQSTLVHQHHRKNILRNNNNNNNDAAAKNNNNKNNVVSAAALFSTSATLLGSQLEGEFTKLPYDDRFPPTPLDHWDPPAGAWKDYNPKDDPDAVKEGGGDYAENEPGYRLDDGSFVFVKEMVCEYVVPDLSDCGLTPYVPFDVKIVTQPAMTPEDLFETLYRNGVERNAQEMIDKDETVASFGQLTDKLFRE